MLVRLYWPNCDSKKGIKEGCRIDRFWVEATKEEAHKYIFPYLDQKKIETSETLALQGEYIAEDLSSPSRPYCFLVAKDLNSINPFKADYPFHQLWNGYSPFEEFADKFIIKNLDELVNIRRHMSSLIDTTFDFRSDTPPGKDPDTLSPTLRKYHKHLWSKPLPNGVVFELVDTTPQVYLHHKSEIGEFSLASDAVVPSFTRENKIAHIIDQIQIKELDAFNSIGYTIGGMMVFPGNRIGRKMTINGARGFHPRIKDRFDLTVECIRRHYLGKVSPLSDVLKRYTEFFKLFEDFRGYTEFFLLQDIVADDFSTVKYFLPFDGFRGSALPLTKEAYLSYKQLAVAFIEARNQRIFQSG